MDAVPESEERLRQLVETTHAVPWEASVETWRFTYVGPQAVDLLGYPVEAWYEEKFWETHIHPEDRQWVIDFCGRSSLTLSDYDFEYRMLTADGRTVWLHDVVKVVVQDGAPHLLRGFMIDISLFKQAELQLKEAFIEIQRLKDRLEVENTYLQEEIQGLNGFHETVGQSGAIRSVLQQVEWVAVTNASVLVLGETGTGKELIARTIHRLSSRSHRPMVKVNCATLPATLIESELFGHERGAFTGALAKRVGRFELADEGTIFLDEIGELPLALQVKLLRVIQEGEFERLGSSTVQRVDLRVIAATNRNLRQAVEEGSFRKDLYFRLNVYPIEVPPLRERAEDIPLLISHFIQKRQGALGRTIDSVSSELIAAFSSYHWPGNIRELENVVEHALIVSPGSKLMLPESVLRNATHESSLGDPGSGWRSQSRVSSARPIRASLDEVERRAISSALEKAGWRIKGKGGAAELLGLKPSTLRSRLKKLGIERPT
jgi:formate hydrogenlyase transcriptional activator